MGKKATGRGRQTREGRGHKPRGAWGPRSRKRQEGPSTSASLGTCQVDTISSSKPLPWCLAVSGTVTLSGGDSGPQGRMFQLLLVIEGKGPQRAGVLLLTSVLRGLPPPATCFIIPQLRPLCFHRHTVACSAQGRGGRHSGCTKWDSRSRSPATLHPGFQCTLRCFLPCVLFHPP